MSAGAVAAIAARGSDGEMFIRKEGAAAAAADNPQPLCSWYPSGRQRNVLLDNHARELSFD